MCVLTGIISTIGGVLGAIGGAVGGGAMAGTLAVANGIGGALASVGAGVAGTVGITGLSTGAAMAVGAGTVAAVGAGAIGLSKAMSNKNSGNLSINPGAYQALLVENNAEVAIGSTVTLPNGINYTKQGLSVKLSTETYTDYDFVVNPADETFRLPIKPNNLNNTRYLIEKGEQDGISYRVYSDGYCEQWGAKVPSQASWKEITLIKTLKKDTFYSKYGTRKSKVEFQGDYTEEDITNDLAEDAPYGWWLNVKLIDSDKRI